MAMEFSEESSIDHTLIFKGKRSKRPRQLSPDDVYSSSPTTSTTQISTSSSSTEEDEDMANCLILLAQSGQSHKQKTTPNSRKFAEIATSSTTNSRKFAEMATSSTGKAGFYVYECKTCNRTFSSFQALGGHRTSHKKSKSIIEETKIENHDHHGVQQQEVAYSNLQNNLNFKKIHECTICGAEFTSGQALGGHMRRHRPPTITTNITNSNIYNSESSNDFDDEIKDKPRIVLSLDLNLPAPVEDEHRRESSKFVFSAAALVDCHY